MVALFRHLIGILRDRNGSAAIEFAIISPFLLVVLIGVVELGFAGYDAMQVEDSVEAGALYAVLHSSDSAGIATAVTSATGETSITATPAPVSFCGCPGASGISAVACTATCAGGSAPGHYITVSASMPRVVIMSQTISSLPTTLTAHSTVRVQ